MERAKGEKGEEKKEWVEEMGERGRGISLWTAKCQVGAPTTVEWKCQTLAVSRERGMRRRRERREQQIVRGWTRGSRRRMTL